MSRCIAAVCSKTCRTFSLRAVALAVVFSLPTSSTLSADELPPLTEIQITSSLDGTPQPSLLWVPESARCRSTPLFVYLHSWSGDYHQNNDPWRREAVERGWIYLLPNFRGPNNQSAACGSPLARQDILDAVDHVIDNFCVDGSRIYLAGTSGGGHMAMLMAGTHPERFSAVSAWAGISDLAAWSRFHTIDGTPRGYALMIHKSTGGPPGLSDAVDAEFIDRSPVTHLQHAVGLPLDINTGVKDGKTGSVPIDHTLRAFNVVARAGGHPQISDADMKELWEQEHLSRPQSSDTQVDSSYERAILLRRYAGTARVTIFDGGHEGLSAAGCHWLSRQCRPTCRLIRNY